MQSLPFSSKKVKLEYEIGIQGVHKYSDLIPSKYTLLHMVHGGILGKESPNRNLNPDQKIGLEPELGVQNNLSPVDEEMMNDTAGHLEKASTYTKTIVSPQNYEK